MINLVYLFIKPVFLIFSSHFLHYYTNTEREKQKETASIERDRNRTSLLLIINTSSADEDPPLFEMVNLLEL
jgi:hypothetical protein